MKKLISFLFLFLIGSEVYAIGSIPNAKVKSIRVDKDGRGMIFFNQPVAGTPPSCVHDAYKSALGIDTNTEAGKAILSLALTAKSGGFLLSVYGTGTCEIYGGRIVETWNYGVMY
ncbi:hypothetical protein [Arcobacter sp. LA11]|uniref:hypothetical protein n=1 Tax=Arcobacter sp. LA11 TaxID=1898176 RepID=UPI001160334A|nr:hypothetical protein [Arcobacter sp. LA11]